MGDKPLPRLFYKAEPRQVAQALLGQRLVRITEDGKRLAGIIVETEAYLGVRDRAAHTFGGRRTKRNESMYAKGGVAYVYFTYGLHHCMNVVCGEVNDPVAVLIRALEPTEGLDTMRRRRGSDLLPDTGLCSGPARLCQALDIDLSLDGVDLTRLDRLWIERRPRPGDRTIARGPRIGVSYAGSWAARHLRYWIRGSAHVSR